MQNLVDHWLAFNSWSTELPVYLQVFLGMSLFFVSASGLVAAIYYIIKLMLRLSAMPVLSHLVGLLGYLLMLMLGWLAYVALPLVFVALSGQQEINLSMIVQAVCLYFVAFILLTIVMMDFMDSRKLWHKEDYTLSTLAKLFNASVWVLAMGYPVLRRWRQAR